MKTLAAAFVILLLASAQEPPGKELVQMTLRARVPASGGAPRLVLEGEAFRSSPLLSCFYERRDYAPAWSHDGALRPAAGDLLSALAAAGDHGLRPENYRSAALQRLTLAELNLPATEHVRQIEANLERWRWLPRDLGQRHVLVNIAGFRLDAFEDGRSALSMRVIVGKPCTRTPMFSSAIGSVVLNPSWNVPRSIVPEVLARARRDPSYLQREGFETLPGQRDSDVVRLLGSDAE